MQWMLRHLPSVVTGRAALMSVEIKHTAPEGAGPTAIPHEVVAEAISAAEKWLIYDVSRGIDGEEMSAARDGLKTAVSKLWRASGNYQTKRYWKDWLLQRAHRELLRGR